MNSLTMNPKQLGWLLLLAISALLLNGCATPAVWNAGSFARYCEPANPPGLALFQSDSRKDVLVQYSEMREEGSSTRPRAYWLFENEERIKERRKPKFVSQKPAAGLIAIPLSTNQTPPEVSNANARYAVVSTNQYAFTLHSVGQEEGFFELPVYVDSSARMKQILLTPPAIIADAAIIGGIVGLACLPLLWTGLNDWVH